MNRALLAAIVRGALALALLAALAAFVWPTRFRYDHMQVDGSAVIVRIDRFTGDADMLLPDQGWVPVEGADDATQGEPSPQKI